MKKLVIVLAILGVVAVGAYIGLGRPQKPAPALAQETVEAPAVEAPTERSVSADGRVAPVRFANLSLPAGGIVAEVLVAEGDETAAGQVLLRLESVRQRAAAAQAEATLQSAQARLAELRAGSRPEEVAAARAGLEAAQATLRKVQEGPDEAQIISARADLANAEAALRQAQAAYDRVSWSNDIGARPESAQLEQATNAYTAAQARLDDLLQGATAADIDAAQASVRQAQAELELRQSGARQESILAAEADVAVAAAGLEQALAALSETELKAPFAGTVAALDAKVGEEAAPGTPLIRLADLTDWRIETDDLTELDIVAVREGAAATITFDAIPDLELPGRVERIKAIGENKQGDITYTVVIAPERTDARLRWNMTASVVIVGD